MCGDVYREMYLHLFNAVTDALRESERVEIINAMRILANAQLDTEAMFVDHAIKDETGAFPPQNR